MPELAIDVSADEEVAEKGNEAGSVTDECSSPSLPFRFSL